MKTCKQCNIEYDDSKKFCKNCGSSLIQQYNLGPKELAKKTVLEEKLKEDPLNEGLLLEYSQFLFKNLLFKESIPNLLKILVINERNDQAKELVFFVYIKLNMIDEASEIAKQLQAKKTKDIPFLEGLANIETQLGNTNKAIDYYEAILKIQPANAKALNKKAILHLENKELEDAVDTFEQLFKEGNRDKTTIIYFGIGKCLSGNFEKTIEVLMPCLEDKDTSLSDFDNQRGFIYLIFCLAKTQSQINKIEEYFYLLEFQIIKDYMLSLDEEILAKSVLEIEIIFLSREKQDFNLGDINYFIERYIDKSSLCFTAHTSKIQAEIWANLSERYKGLGLFSDSQASLKKATELYPENTEYKKKLHDITTQSEKQKRKQKRKKLTIIGSLISLLVIIVVAVIFFNWQKENKAWEAANTENTSISYQRYLRGYPNGRFHEKAEELQEAAVWAESSVENSIIAYERYSARYPQGKYTIQAKSKTEDLFWESTIKTNSWEAYRDYAAKYPNGKYIEEANNVLLLIDPRDNKRYKTIKIGQQLWLAENLNYHILSGSWCYNNRSSDCDTYGRLYTYNAALNACPPGWHLPSDNEWDILINYLGGYRVAGSSLKTMGTNHWDSFSNIRATNQSEFSALPGGMRRWDGGFTNLGRQGHWWSSTERPSVSWSLHPPSAWHRAMFYSDNEVNRFAAGKTEGLSVRCIKDKN